MNVLSMCSNYFVLYRIVYPIAVAFQLCVFFYCSKFIVQLKRTITYPCVNITELAKEISTFCSLLRAYVAHRMCSTLLFTLLKLLENSVQI